ncbi:hypothetical protein [Brevibacillus sp. FIR094]|uniref:hypothetical protein n=1 Tax=Brevibacillus sp. FIR094 TaxID=3134809 RepID=UPI003D239FC3
MLADIERKVLRILGNYYAMNPTPPSINVIFVKTGRSREGVITVLDVLAREEYIRVETVGAGQHGSNYIVGTTGTITVAKKIDNLFASMRMVLPEYRTELLKHNEERDLIKRPEVDDEDFGEMCSR